MQPRVFAGLCFACALQFIVLKQQVVRIQNSVEACLIKADANAAIILSLESSTAATHQQISVLETELFALAVDYEDVSVNLACP